jgi:hypothetical protein
MTCLDYKKTVLDYDEETTVKPTTYTDAKYSRLVKVVGGVDEYDTVMDG